MGGCQLDSSGSGQGPVADGCEHGNEPLDSIKGREFPDRLSEFSSSDKWSYAQL
jgi:hypothetical protein